MELFNKRLLIISGKGGVGKSTICASLALIASKYGKRVLIVEVGSKERIQELFNQKEGNELLGIEKKLYENIYLIHFDPLLALEDFIYNNIIKAKFLVKRFLNSSLIRYILEAAPGWKELITLGHTWHLLVEMKREKTLPLYDIAILDAPATGHALSMLQVPKIITAATGSGLLYKTSESIYKFLLNPEETSLNIVTIPEEMPVTEAIEMYNLSKNFLKIPFGYIFMNRFYPPIADEGSIKSNLDKITKNGDCKEAILKSLRYSLKQRERSEYYLNIMKDELECKFIEVPFIFDKEFELGSIIKIASYIEKQLNNWVIT